MSANEVTWETDHGDEVEVWRAGVRRSDDADVFRWRVRARNGEIVGSGEGHPRIEDAIAAAERHHPRVEGKSPAQYVEEAHRWMREAGEDPERVVYAQPVEDIEP